MSGYRLRNWKKKQFTGTDFSGGQGVIFDRCSWIENFESCNDFHTINIRFSCIVLYYFQISKIILAFFLNVFIEGFSCLIWKIFEVLSVFTRYIVWLSCLLWISRNVFNENIFLFALFRCHFNIKLFPIIF